VVREAGMERKEKKKALRVLKKLAKDKSLSPEEEAIWAQCVNQLERRNFLAAVEDLNVELNYGLLVELINRL
jgi:hypothetical protein